MSGISVFLREWAPYIAQAVGETFVMVGVSLAFSVAIALPLGALLVVTGPGRPRASRLVHGALNLLINLVRSLPFIILLFFMLPVTKAIAGTTIGVRGVIVPLVAYSAPYIARLIESSLLEVDRGVIEAYEAMGVRGRDLVVQVLIREARPSLLRSLTIATIGLVGATAMAGLVGAGGLGDLAYRFGFVRYENAVMYVTVALLIALVQLIQTIGNGLARRLSKGG
ncbi:MAG TPA: methionine ABC transporter permease [Spirochaetales bacterium]|nr:methionine ABC transporter permease [Spirochaetales bacterium]HRY55511.1 methionine ABC transporter permease [Spirochaetia bacterium]HRZ66076.1 methionine ABC transporter permease [Spirochaetia bacterium]